jgi:hypothetical protein
MQGCKDEDRRKKLQDAVFQIEVKVGAIRVLAVTPDPTTGRSYETKRHR